ncbi:LamG-like jellyroll fold domain-containing protein [Candidatus Nanosalina sp. VS9-1]|uniref:LamG-like jellyroll fold domain-containing protein n=1 Tax=Candidatus Nanosalina sp. VS9-1 TaxID=3388566 RepID=UPI0039E04347
MTLTGYWPLTGTSGEAYDHSGRDNHGTLLGGVSQGAKGLLGENSHSFDGVDGRIRHDYRTSPSFTVNVWMHSAQSTWNATGAGWSDRSASGFIIHPDGDESGWSGYVLENTKDGYYKIGSYTADNVDSWNMYTITHENNTGTSRMFFNGEQVMSKVTTTSRVVNTNTGTLGHDDMDSYSASERALEGRIAEARYYSRPLTGSEIRYLYSIKSRGLHTSSSKSS